MPRFVFTLTNSQKNWIEAQAAERDVSQGEIIRRVIKSAMNDTDTDSVTDTASVSQDEFEQLQKRVSQLGADIDTLDHDNQQSSSTTIEGTNSTDDSIVTVDDVGSESLQEFVADQTE
jgi:hypothetical protein